jgi:diguanylate cyclase (GGDEF)-like protein
MYPTEPVLGALAVTALVAVALAVLLVPAIFGRGPLARRILARARRRELTEANQVRPSPAPSGAITPSVQLLARKRHSQIDSDPATRLEHASSDELQEVMQGVFGADSINRAIRVLAYAFILVVLGIVSLSQLWQSVQPQIFAVLAAAGVFVLVVHELFPATGRGMARIFVEGTSAVVFLTALVLLTGNVASPFFFVYAPVMGGVALVASPLTTLALAVEVIVAYGVAALAGPDTSEAATRDTIVRVAANLMALVVLTWAGLAIAQVQKRTREAAIRLSTVDSLTDLCNRGYFFNAVDREIQRSRRFGRGFCLLMMDLDGLKPINDRYGHFHGDLVLRAVADVIRTGLRGVDVPARYGGDEFVALLPETDSSGAFVVAEKIRLGVSEMVIEGAGQQVRTSLSIGVVAYPDDGHTADELMIAADEAMYASKRLGKNRVVGYADPGDVSAPFVAPRRQVVSTPGFRPTTRDIEPYPERGPRDRTPWERDRVDADRDEWDPRERGGGPSQFPPQQFGPTDLNRNRDRDVDRPRDISDRGSA